LVNAVIDRTMLRDQIKKILIEAIISGELKPGDKIVETRLAKELSVSQAPIREAILELEQVGLIKTSPYKGAFVKVFSKRDIEEAYQVRALLESEAASGAAKKITGKEIEHLEEIYKDLITVAKKNDAKSYIKIDVSFHERIVQINNNSLLYRFWKQISSVQLTYISVIRTYEKYNLEELAIRHKELIETFVKHDANLARERMFLHIHEFLADFLDRLS